MARSNGRMRVALLNVSHTPAAAAANFRRAFQSIDDVDLVAYDARNLELPEPGAVDAAVVTGSIDSVNDDLEYVRAAREWLRTADVPVFGVCFGHQLVASAFGGEVAHMPERELGYRRIALDRPDDPLFDGVADRPTAFLCHEDTVVEPPAGATVLASNEYGIQALRLGRTVSVQFHPEVDGAHARRLLAELDLPAEWRERALETVTDANATAASRLRRLFENFVAHLDEEPDGDDRGR